MARDASPALVLDLDETLIFGSPIRSDAASIQVRVRNRRFFIRMRPGLADFVKSVSPVFDIFFFTASSPEYANPIIEAIVPESPTDHRFSRENCTMSSGYAIKDLRTLNRPLKQIVLVDDIEGSALFQPRNLVRIAPWYGTDENDKVLMQQLLPLLEEISKARDIPSEFRKIIDSGKMPDLHTSKLPDPMCLRIGS
jgi:Dullard-like phosphatase family protein